MSTKSEQILKDSEQLSEQTQGDQSEQTQGDQSKQTQGQLSIIKERFQSELLVVKQESYTLKKKLYSRGQLRLFLVRQAEKYYTLVTARTLSRSIMEKKLIL